MLPSFASALKFLRKDPPALSIPNRAQTLVAPSRALPLDILEGESGIGPDAKV